MVSHDIVSKAPTSELLEMPLNTMFRTLIETLGVDVVEELFKNAGLHYLLYQDKGWDKVLCTDQETIQTEATIGEEECDYDKLKHVYMILDRMDDYDIHVMFLM